METHYFHLFIYWTAIAIWFFEKKILGSKNNWFLVKTTFYYHFISTEKSVIEYPKIDGESASISEPMQSIRVKQSTSLKYLQLKIFLA